MEIKEISGESKIWLRSGIRSLWRPNHEKE